MEAELKRAARLMAELSEQGWDEAQMSPAFCFGLGLICSRSENVAQSVTAACAVVEHAAGVKSNNSVALRMPCAGCWSAALSGIEQRGLTGSVTHYCPHRALGFLVHAEHGTATAWTVKPMAAAEIEEINRQIRRELFKQQGLKPVR